MPADPAVDWVDVLIGVDTFANACKLAIEVGEDQAILKRMISTFEDPIPTTYFLRHKPYLKEGEAVLAVMVSRDTLDALATRVAGFEGAEIRLRYDELGEGARLPAAFELAWNHTTLRALRVDPTITYVQMMMPRPVMFEKIPEVKKTFGDEVLLHFEFTRFDGVVSPVGIPLIRHTTNERLEEIIQIFEAELGLPVFNPHRVTLEEGGMKRTNPDQLAFKKETDPKGLMNPGKMIAWVDPDWVPVPGKTYLFAE